MKKLIILLFLILAYNIAQAKDYTLLQGKNEFSIRTINTKNITTKNYDEISNLKVLGVYYQINPLYERFFKTNYYEFKNEDMSKDMEDLEEYYINVLDNNNLKKEVNNIIINGIKISKIKVYISDVKLEEIASN